MLPVESGHIHIPTTNVSYFHFFLAKTTHLIEKGVCHQSEMVNSVL